MKHNFWRVLALAVLAAALFFFLAGRFNVISTGLGAILLLAAGRLLEPLWAALPFGFSRELMLSWLLLSVPGWWLGRSPAAGG